MNIILASASPRRKEILDSLMINYQCIPSSIDEEFDNSLDGKEIVMYLAEKKARDVLEKNKGALVIGADTIVYLDHQVIGKPHNQEECFKMIKALSNKTHSVLTGVALLSDSCHEVFYEESFVTFREISDEEIAAYVQEKEPYDKAGGYAIQGIARQYVLEYIGDYYNIVGLPKEALKKHLEKIIF